MSLVVSSSSSNVSTTASALGSYTIDHLPEDPQTIPSVKRSYELIKAARDPKLERVADSIYRSSWDLLSPVYELIKGKANSSFSFLWAIFFEQVASCQLHLNKLEAAEESHLRFLAIAPQNSSSAENRTVTQLFFLSLGRRVEGVKNYSFAIQKYSQGIERGGPNFSLHFRKYFVMSEHLGKHEEAIENLLQAEECFSGHPNSAMADGLYHLSLYYKHVDFGKAEVYLKQAHAQFRKEENEIGMKNCEAEFAKVEKLRQMVRVMFPVTTDWASSRFKQAYDSAKSYEDNYHRAMAYKGGKRFGDAGIFTARAKELAKTKEELRECAFLKHSIQSAMKPLERPLLKLIVAAEKYNRQDSLRDGANFSYNIAMYYLNNEDIEKAKTFASKALKKYEQKQRQKDVQDCKDLLVAIGLSKKITEAKLKEIRSTTTTLVVKIKEERGATTPSSWAPSLLAKYIAANSYEKIFSLALAYKEAGQLVDAYICLGKAKDLAGKNEKLKKAANDLAATIKKELDARGRLALGSSLTGVALNAFAGASADASTSAFSTPITSASSSSVS